MEKFKNSYKIAENSIPVAAETISAYKDKVPEILLDIWKSDGFGKYNKGIIEMINPKEYEPVLWTWLGREVENYVPFAITGFGELFYYRKLTETDEDVCIIDIQFRNIETLNWSLQSFFEDSLPEEEFRDYWLREELFKNAITELGELAPNEIFTFTPVLSMGGAEEVQQLKKGNAQVYQELVFQMTM